MEDRPQHRASVKQHNSGSWREKIRDDCRRLLRERRQQTLQRHRQTQSPGSAAHLQSTLQSDVRAAVQDIISSIQSGGPSHTDGSGSGGFDRGPCGPGAPHGAGGAAPPAAADVDAFLAGLEQQMVDEMLLELEQLEAYEADALAAAVAERDALEAAAAAGAPSDAGGALSPSPHSHHAPPPPRAAPGGEQLLCPVCMGAFLLQRAGVVVCPRGCMQLNLAAESLSLGDLRARLQATYEEHRASGCGGSLAFRVEELFGARNLVSSCRGCPHYRVVA
ncbi:MAG: replication protein A interacting C-terminal-domain-containing protein [Monoraphidium minutum]|nr:MAG: replication protein A interacting C-terminal-domain-containing protein [Monoraphidium minutum]